MARGETAQHARLKALALAWATANGFPSAQTEVRVPRSGFRADVAAAGAEATAPTALFECKQARADLLKDAHAEAATRGELARLLERRRELEAQLAVHRPDLRCGEALWPEFDRWDFSSLEHRTHRRVLEDIERLQRRVLRGTKFSRMFRYRSADVLYLVVEDDIFAEAEIPAGWGLLVRVGEQLQVRRAPVPLETVPEQRAALWAAIAAKAAAVAAGGWTSGQSAYNSRHD